MRRLPHDLFAGCVRLSVGYVFGDRSSEQPCVLQDHAEIVAQAMARQFGRGDPVDSDAPAVTRNPLNE